MLDYQDFLASKRTIAQTSGIEVSLDAIHPMLFPFQKELVRWALRKGRCALFADAGLGKTFMSVEFARLTGQKTLIIAPLSVARQTVSEALKINVEVHYTRSGADVISGINITNYEMIDHFNFDEFGCIILDESSILKNLTGVTCQKLIEKSKSVPYRLGCTATPAPNDFVELGNHAEFLGIMTGQEMKSQFFIHDSNSSAHGGWRLKGHALEVFYQWLASWSMSVKKPSDLGVQFDDTGYDLPPLHIERSIVECDYVPEGQLFFAGLKGVSDRAKVRKATIEDRIQKAVKLIASNDEQWIVWTGLNDESSALAKRINGAVELTGNDSSEKKIQTIQDFQDGKIRVLVTKGKIAGMGINLQNCHNMAFVGLSDSYELYYQCIRRCYRFGQSKSVHAYIVLSDIEEEIFQNVLRKEEEAKKMSDELIKNVQQFEKAEIENTQSHQEYREDIIQTDEYTLMLGDSCERMKEIADNSVDLSIFSPPFASLYTYSPTERDLGNSRNRNQFFEHFRYIIDELMRVIKPGRNICVHVSQIPLTLISDGVIGIHDFRGDVIWAFVERGWIYHSDITIDKNPQTASIRSHAKGLAFQQLEKDTSEMRSTFADYVLVFKKPGKNVVPVKQQLTREEWILWASAIWYDIEQTDTLNAREAKEAKDERHVCPLQLGLIERLLRLYSNEGEIILDPFTGIGSTGYKALDHNRKFLGCELKPSYFKTAEKNLNQMLGKRTQTTLWDLAEV